MNQVNEDKCRLLAEQLLRTVDFSLLSKMQGPAVSNANLEKLFFYLSAICHNTKGKFRGQVNGKKVKGWNYLQECFIRGLNKNQHFLSLENMKTISKDELLIILSDDMGTLPKEDLSERALILRTVAESLEVFGDFPFSKEEASFREMQIFLSKIPYYQDPVFKKANLLISCLYDLGVWKLSDPEHLEACIDYHIIRGAFRTGIIDVSEEFAGRLRRKEEISLDEDVRIRKIVLQAINLVAEHSGKRSIEVGNYFWFHFRKNCRSDKPVNCDNCKNIAQIEKRGACNLKGVCAGYNNPVINSIPETTVNTDYY